MEVTSSTVSSSSMQDDQPNTPQTSELASTSNDFIGAAGDGLNNSQPMEYATSMELVCYGPSLPPPLYQSETGSYSKDVPDPKAVAGSCGLYNLGNTCFMNSGLQSLMACGPLVKFFSEQFSLTDAVRDSLVGYFHVLLCKIWSGQFSTVHPRKFKEMLGFYHSQFEDFRQHDCQEFLALMLDTLHEQLNQTHSLPLGLGLMFDESHACAVLGQETTPLVHEVDLNNKLAQPKGTCSVLSVDHHHNEVVEADVISEPSSSDQEPSRLLPDEIEAHSNREGSPSDVSVVESMVPSPCSHGEASSVCKLEDEDLENEITSSSFVNLRPFNSRSDSSDVSSSDITTNALVKPSLKRVSSGNSVSASGLVFTSEDSNHSSLSAHSTDSEQSSAFKRLKIDSVAEVNKNGNNVKDCVTSSSDSKRLRGRKAQNDSEKILISGNEALTLQNCPKDLNIIDNIVSSCSQIDSKFSNTEEAPHTLIGFDDFYSKETKTLNTNVLVSEFLQDITSDSEKFAKIDNRNRPTSKEVNILQDFEEEDKTDKILIGERLGLKDNNIFQASNLKDVKNFNVINKTQEVDLLSLENVSKAELFQQAHVSKLKSSVVTGSDESDILTLKLLENSSSKQEEEKNVQMQAYTKFNTANIRTNIRSDLTGKAGSIEADSVDVEEMEVDSSDDDAESSVIKESSTVEECSSVPNCMRHCQLSEVSMANKAWTEYTSRNNSIIVSTFQGQFRSTVVCSECSHVSVTYEPFMYLSLPIPHAMDLQMCVVYICQDKPATRYLLNLLKTDKVETAKTKLKEMVGQGGQEMLMAEVLDFHVSRILDDNFLLKYVNMVDRQIYAFESISLPDKFDHSSNDMDLQPLNNKNDTYKPIEETKLSGPGIGASPIPSNSQGSNHSFDSVNVNTPSSRDALDFTSFSDNELADHNLDTPQSENSSETPWLAGEIFPTRKPDRRISEESESSPILHDKNLGESVFSNVKNFGKNDKNDEFAENISSRPERDINSTPSQQSTKISVLDFSQFEHGDTDKNFCKNFTSTFREQEGSVSVSTSTSTIVASQLSMSCPSPEQQMNKDFSQADVTARLNSAATKLSNEAMEPFLYSDSDVCPVGRQRSSSWSGRMTNRVGHSSKRSSSPSLDARPNTLSIDISGHASLKNSQVTTNKVKLVAEDWKTCAICLEDMAVADLLTHVSCDGAFCHNCLDMSVKHTADIGAFCCPICLQPAKVIEDFIPYASISTKRKVRMLSLSVAFRHKVQDNNGRENLRLFAHPNMVQVPSRLEGAKLYSLIDSLLGHRPLIYSVLLTDGQGLSCSRCQYSSHCTGCEVSREGELNLYPSDSLAVHVTEEDHWLPNTLLEDVSIAGLRSSEPTTIMDCFGAFTQSEILDEHNPWYCPNCAKNQCAKKTMTVWRYPDNLIIHLKRFVYQDLSSTKVDTRVVFPHTDMDVRGFLSGPSSSGLVYDLFSIICHFGGASSGHYTSYARHPLTDQWYYYNDETVTQQCPGDGECSSAYVLFYRRQGTKVTFTPPSVVPNTDDSTTTTTSTTTTNKPATSSSNNSMALVLFQPPSTTSKQNQEDDDYDIGSSSTTTSTTAHVVSSPASTSRHTTTTTASCISSSSTCLSLDAANSVAPDSTYDFYS